VHPSPWIAAHVPGGSSVGAIADAGASRDGVTRADAGRAPHAGRGALRFARSHIGYRANGTAQPLGRFSTIANGTIPIAAVTSAARNRRSSAEAWLPTMHRQGHATLPSGRHRCGMGLFSDLFSTRPDLAALAAAPSADQLEALLATMCVVAFADGELSE